MIGNLCFARAALLALTMAAVSLAASAGQYEKRSTEAARPIQSATDAGKVERIDFNQGNIKIWLLKDGTWWLQGKIQHRGLRCADYKLGARFGIGERGCEEVAWQGDVQFVAQTTLCNNATANPAGSATDPDLAQQLDKISCVERVLRCSGKCD